MAKEPDTKVAVADAAGANNLPSYLQGKNYQGPEDNFDSSDVVVPRIKLLQATSPEVENFSDIAKPGLFWHTGMDISLGESIKFVVVSRRKKYLLVTPMDDKQGVLARSDDAKTWDRTGKWTVKVDKRNTVDWEIKDLDVVRSGLAEWGTSFPGDENSPPAATLFYDYLVLVVGFEDLGPAVLSLARSAIQPAKKGLNDKIAMHGQQGRPMQALVFMAKPIDAQNDSGQGYKQYHFSGSGFADEATFNAAIGLADTFKDYSVKDEGQDDASKRVAEKPGAEY